VDFCFIPGSPRWVREETGDYFNTYREEEHPKSGGEVETWAEFLHHLLPKEDEREWFENWLAYKAQHPEQKCHGVLMVAHRVYGSGRGTLFEIVRKTFGPHNTRTVDFNAVAGRGGQAQYNDWMSGCMFVLVPEVKETDPYAARAHNVKEQAYEAIKEASDPTASCIRIKEKYGRIREVRTYANLLAATNHNDAIALPADDRRLAVLSNGPPMSVELATRVHAWLADPANIGALWRRLTTMETEYVPSGTPIRTSAKTTMVAASASDVDVIVTRIREVCAGSWVSFPRALEIANEVAAIDNLELGPAATAYLRRVLKRELPRRAARVRTAGGALVYAHHVRGPEGVDSFVVRDEMFKSEGPILENEEEG